jgi:hypothetical protein
MLWAVGSGGAVGLLLGLRFKVSALLAACAFLAIAPLAGWTPNVEFQLLALFGALQLGFLAGVTLMSGCWRARLRN